MIHTKTYYLVLVLSYLKHLATYYEYVVMLFVSGFAQGRRTPISDIK